MNVAETLLVFVGAPLAVIVLLALLIFLPGGQGRRSRYKPGQPWDHEPVWYEPHPDHAPAAGHGDGHGDGAAGGPGQRHGETQAVGSSLYGELTGGHAHGPDAHGAGAHGAATSGHRPVPAGPLGGARGTW